MPGRGVNLIDIESLGPDITVTCVAGKDLPWLGNDPARQYWNKVQRKINLHGNDSTL